MLISRRGAVFAKLKCSQEMREPCKHREHFSTVPSFSFSFFISLYLSISLALSRARLKKTYVIRYLANNDRLPALRLRVCRAYIPRHWRRWAKFERNCERETPEEDAPCTLHGKKWNSNANSVGSWSSSLPSPPRQYTLTLHSSIALLAFSRRKKHYTRKVRSIRSNIFAARTDSVASIFQKLIISIGV